MLEEARLSPSIPELLKSAPLFSGLEDPVLEGLARACEVRTFKADTDILHQGEEGQDLYLVSTGQVAVVRVDPHAGTESRLSVLGPGEVFGEMALLVGEPRSATVRALQDSACVVLTRDGFEQALDTFPEISRVISVNLAHRVQKMNQALGYRFVHLGEADFRPELYEMFPSRVLEELQVVPLRLEGSTLVVATPRPGQLEIAETLRSWAPGLRIEFAACAETDYIQLLIRVIQPHLNRSPYAFEDGERPHLEMKDFQVLMAESSARDTSDAFAERPAEVVNQALLEALNAGASDVHLDADTGRGRVRFRIDGDLQERDVDYDARMHPAVIRRIKILASLDISDHHRPQDGRIRVMAGGRTVDLRVNVMPTVHGEKVALRVLDLARQNRSLSQVIHEPEVASILRAVVAGTSGCLLVAGPTGSGKTTTLYSALQDNEELLARRHVTTVEDPVEYTLPGASQAQVHEGLGRSFAMMLRALMRQDPDVILVGEIRDPETARTAMEAGLTGHLVLSTVHAETVFATMTRLEELNCNPFLVASALRLVIAQRLLRRVCPECRVEHRFGDFLRQALDSRDVLPMEVSGTLYKGAGCPRCEGTGYSGRVAACQTLRLVPAVQEAMFGGGSPAQIRAAAVRHRALTDFSDYCRYLLINGYTTPSEVMRILGDSLREGGEGAA